MCGQERVIDLTGLLDVHVSGQRKRKRQSAALDSSEAAANTVDLSRSDQDDEAGPSNYTPPAFTLEDEAHETAARSEVTRSTKGKQERSEAASAKQAEAKKQQLNAKKAEAKAERDAARLVKKARSCEQKRVNQLGNIVRYASNAPQKTKERMVRALPNSGHRMFLLDRHMVSPMTSENGPIEEYSVLGATANVYQVTVGKHPDCTCPDFQKGNLCKHYLFVMLRVLRLDQTDPLVWQKALLKSEAEQVLGGTRSTRADIEVLADQSVITHYRRLTGRDTASTSSAADGPGGSDSKQRPIEGECAICYDTLKADGQSAEDKVTFCQDCGNNVHVECFKRWTARKRSSGEPVTCVYCRCPWPGEPGTKGAGGRADEYVNLRDVSHPHQAADTSLQSLYGDTAVWIQANAGRLGRRQAANLWRLSQAS